MFDRILRFSKFRLLASSTVLIFPSPFQDYEMKMVQVLLLQQLFAVVYDSRQSLIPGLRSQLARKREQIRPRSLWQGGRHHTLSLLALSFPEIVKRLTFGNQ